MSFLKRTFLYLARKKGKNVILFLLIFFISTFILCCFSLLYATKDVAKNMRTSVGASFHIRSLAGMSFTGTRNDEAESAIIAQQTIQTIMRNEELKYYNARNSGYVKSKQIIFFPGMGHSEENSMGQVEANDYSILHTLFQDETLKLLDGRHITPRDENVLLISKQLADINQLTIGDKIALAPADLSKQNDVFIDRMKDTPILVEAQIIGIYQILNPQGDAAYQPTAGLRTNLLFSDHTLLTNLGLAKKGEYTGGISFYIQDPIYLDAAMDEIKQMDAIDWNRFFIRKDDWSYEKISSGLAMIQNLIRILLLCVCVVSFCVLLLILAMRIRNRVHEAGILLSVGIAKREIMGQFILEVVVIAVAAFICSYFLAGFVAGRIEGPLLDNIPIRIMEEQVLETGLEKANDSKIVINTPVKTICAIYFFQFTAILFAVFVSSWAIIKLKPKDILSKMS